YRERKAHLSRKHVNREAAARFQYRPDRPLRGCLRRTVGHDLFLCDRRRDRRAEADRTLPDRKGRKLGRNRRPRLEPVARFESGMVELNVGFASQAEMLHARTMIPLAPRADIRATDTRRERTSDRGEAPRRNFLQPGRGYAAAIASAARSAIVAL